MKQLIGEFRVKRKEIIEVGDTNNIEYRVIAQANDRRGNMIMMSDTVKSISESEVQKVEISKNISVHRVQVGDVYVVESVFPAPHGKIVQLKQLWSGKRGNRYTRIQVVSDEMNVGEHVHIYLEINQPV